MFVCGMWYLKMKPNAIAMPVSAYGSSQIHVSCRTSCFLGNDQSIKFCSTGLYNLSQGPPQPSRSSRYPRYEVKGLSGSNNRTSAALRGLKRALAEVVQTGGPAFSTLQFKSALHSDACPPIPAPPHPTSNQERQARPL